MFRSYIFILAKGRLFFHDKILTLANFWRNEVIYDEY